MQTNEQPRKFSLIPDRLRDAVKSVFGLIPQTKAADARAEKQLSTRGDSFTTSMQAAFARQLNHNIRGSYRRNTRGLPIGVGSHQLRAAKRIKNALARDPENANIGESRLHAAETVLDQVKRNAEMRTKVSERRGAKVQRRTTLQRRSLSLKDWCAAHTARLQENKRSGRVPYIRPAVDVAA